MKLWILGACDASFAADLQQASSAWPVAPSALAFLTPPGNASLQAIRAHDFVALMGRASQTEQDCWRAQLALARLPFQVFYGDSEQVLQNLSFAWSSHVRSQSALRPEILPRWEGVCESCSDPECEHRMFSRLLAHPPSQ